MADQIIINPTTPVEINAVLPEKQNVYIFLTTPGLQTVSIVVRASVPYAQVECTVLGLHDADDDYTITTQQLHEATDTSTSIKVRSVLADKARCTFTGLIHVPLHIQRVSAVQQASFLQLDDTTRVQATPALEVLAHEVHCKHTSACGTIQNKQIAYLLSRGIFKEQAVQLLIDSFCLIDENNIHVVAQYEQCRYQKTFSAACRRYADVS